MAAVPDGQRQSRPLFATALLVELLATVLLLALAACSKSSAPNPHPAALAALKAKAHAAEVRVDFDAMSRRVLDEIVRLETTKDVTCWTTFRQLDDFISSKQYSDFATQARITAAKALVRAAWAKASQVSPGPFVQAHDLLAVVPESAPFEAERLPQLAAFASDKGLKAFRDYRTTSEHWRVVLAVLADEMQRDGDTPLEAPQGDAAWTALADVTTRLGLLLLQKSGQHAIDERTPFIEATAVQRAHAAIADKLGLRNQPRTAPLKPDADRQAAMAPLTKVLIEGKIKALHTFNRNSQDLTADLNRLSKVPVTADALAVWRNDLQSFAHFLVAGFDPMQADNFLADGQFAETALQRKAWIDYAHAENVTMQLFPHDFAPNGDMRLRFEPNPGFPDLQPRPAGKKRAGFDVLILDHEQNGMRDTAIHWLALEQVWKEKPFALEPFAAEYVSEVLSMMATWYLRRAEAIALELGKTTIDAEVAAKVRDRDYVMVRPETPEQATVWPPERWKVKAALLAQYPQARFEDVTAAAGLPVALPAEASASSFDIHKVMGAGLATGDLDGDGFTDLFVGGEGLGRLYLNGGKAAPGRFKDVTAAWGVPVPLEDARGALMLDQDGDGDLDLLVLRSEHPALLLRQEGGRFSDVAAQVGLKTHRGAHVATAFDADRDGDLDLYIGYYGSDAANRTQTATRNLPALDGRNGTPHQLFRLGKDGRYEDVATAAGVADVHWTLAQGTFDYDDDGDLDLFLANDFGEDVLFRNKGDGTFEDVARATRTDDRGSGMNVSFSDVNRDGKLDLYVSNIDMFSKNIKVIYPHDDSTIHNLDENLARVFQYLSGNKLYLNPGDPAGKKPFASEQLQRFEPGDRGWGWASVFFDYDLDGDEDLYLANGWIAGSFAADQHNQMFLMQDGYFYQAPEAGSAETFAGNSRSVAALDLEGDGDLDLVVNNFRQPPRVLRNVQAQKNRRLRLMLRQPGPNTRAIGARVTVTAGGQRQVREVTCGGFYLGQGEGVETVGLGAAKDAEVSVRWPDGTVQALGKLPAGVHAVVKR